MTDPIYLDNAATTPLDPAVLEAMRPYLTELFYNPSAQYDAARRVKQDVEAARAVIAGHIGARSSEIVFTAGGTEANNLVIKGVMQQHPDANIIVSAIEHDSVLRPAAEYNAKLLPVSVDGRVSLNNLKELIDANTVLVSVQYANNEIGTVQSIKEIGQLIADIKKTRVKTGNTLPLIFHTYACQASAYLDLHASRLGVDAMTINASKIYGPKQIGALFIKAGTKIHPQILGGGQEKGYRSGTENVANIIGFAKALSLVQTKRHDEASRLSKLRELFIELLESSIPSIVINGSRKYRLANNLHITVPGQDNERLMMELDNRGIICAVGSACSASNDEPSHVLKAVGLSDKDAQASLRFTMGNMTTEEQIHQVVSALSEIIR